MHSTTTDHRTTSRAMSEPFRLLVISNETVEGELLHEAIVGLAAERSADVVVVAPALNSRLRHWLSDEDGVRRAARARLERCLDRLEADGIRVNGWVGDADPLVAIEDALRSGDVDELLIATHPEDRSNWLAHDLVERAAVRFGLPTATSSSTGSTTVRARACESVSWSRRDSRALNAAP